MRRWTKSIVVAKHMTTVMARRPGVTITSCTRSMKPSVTMASGDVVSGMKVSKRIFKSENIRHSKVVVPLCANATDNSPPVCMDAPTMTLTTISRCRGVGATCDECLSLLRTGPSSRMKRFHALFE